MKVIRALLYCLLWFTLAFLLMFFIVYREYKEYRDMPTITINVGTWDLNSNNLPTLDTLSISFPWYSGDEMPNCYGDYNKVVQITAINPIDTDGMISRLVFYYYNVDDPSRILEYKESLIFSPYVYFVLPRTRWEYRFWVILYDNYWWVVNSEDIIWKWPSTFVSSCDSPDVPTITLISNAKEVEVWDTVTYSIVSRTLLGDTADFEKNRLFYYDFTWDWERDLITWSDSATYTFNEMDYYSIRPRAAVEYHDKLSIWEGREIIVKGWRTQYDDNVDWESMDEYEKNKTDILIMMPKWEKSEIEALFDKFEGTDSKEGKASILKWMRKTISVDWLKSKKIDKDDVEILRWNFCSIAEYYDFYYDVGNMCSTDKIIWIK